MKMRRYLFYLKGGWPEFLFATYASSGIALFLVLHAQASVYLQILGESYYTYSLEEAVTRSAFWSAIVFVSIYFSTSACYKGMKGSKLRRAGPFVDVFLLTVLGLLALHGSSGALDAASITYLFALDGLLGATLFLFFNHPDIAVAGTGREASALLEVLKMEHREFLQYINLVVWSNVVIFTGAVITSLIPRFTYLQGTTTQRIALGLILANYAILVIYFVVGVWFGIIGQLLARLETIRQNVFSLREELPP